MLLRLQLLPRLLLLQLRRLLLLQLPRLLLLLLLLLLQLLLLLLLQETANRRLTDSAEVSQSRHPELLLCQNVSVFHTVLLSQSVLQSQKPSLSPTVLLCQTVSVCQNAALFQDRNAPQSPELSQPPSPETGCQARVCSLQGQGPLRLWPCR